MTINNASTAQEFIRAWSGQSRDRAVRMAKIALEGQEACISMCRGGKYEVSKAGHEEAASVLREYIDSAK